MLDCVVYAGEYRLCWIVSFMHHIAFLIAMLIILYADECRLCR
jgi:hypothetical protein